jgi:hypothetical protein
MRTTTHQPHLPNQPNSHHTFPRPRGERPVIIRRADAWPGAGKRICSRCPGAPHDQHDAQTAYPNQRRRSRLAAHDSPVHLTPSGVMPSARSGDGLLVNPARPAATRSAVTGEGARFRALGNCVSGPPTGSSHGGTACRGGSRVGASWLCCRLVTGDQEVGHGHRAARDHATPPSCCFSAGRLVSGPRRTTLARRAAGAAR